MKVQTILNVTLNTLNNQIVEEKLSQPLFQKSNLHAQMFDQLLISLRESQLSRTLN